MPFVPHPKDTREIRRLKRATTTESLWFWIFLLLSRKQYHAYVMRREIEERYGFRPGMVTAYKVLYLLEQGRLVSKARKGNKVYYRITLSGRKQLALARRYLDQLAAL